MLIAMVAGAAVGAGAEWLFRPEGDRHLYLAGFTAAWLAMGVITILTGDMWWEARSAPVTHADGMPARVMGALM
jgi:hypothetical protein